MATTITVKDSGGDYNNLQDALNAACAETTPDLYSIVCWGGFDLGIATASAMGFTPDPTNHIEVVAASGEVWGPTGGYDLSKAKIIVPTGSFGVNISPYPVSTGLAYFKIRGIQFVIDDTSDPSTAGLFFYSYPSFANIGMVADSCLFMPSNGSSSVNRPIGFQTFYTSGITLQNNVFYRITNNIAPQCIAFAQTTNLTLRSNTAVDCMDPFVVDNKGFGSAADVYLTGNTSINPVSGTGFGAVGGISFSTFDRNASTGDISSFGGTGNLSSIASTGQFANIISDWKLIPTSDMNGAGGAPAVIDDATGNARLNPTSIGAFEAYIDSTTGLTSSGSPSTYGNAVTFTATVSAASGTPTGAVQFKDNGINLGVGPVALSAGVATFATSALTPGSHVITADYLGDTGFNTSTATLAGGQDVVDESTTTALTSSLNPSVFGASVTFTAIVSAGSGTPTGDVEFFDGASSLGIIPLVAGVATVAISDLTVGNHTIIAQYGGDTGFAASNDTLLGGQQVIASENQYGMFFA